jgi:hypothetical protein
MRCDGLVDAVAGRLDGGNRLSSSIAALTAVTGRGQAVLALEGPIERRSRHSRVCHESQIPSLERQSGSARPTCSMDCAGTT